jgi:selenocysteine lyase/cysteine desulfurase
MPSSKSRRSFLTGAVGTAVSVRFPSLLNAAVDGEAYWTLVRNHFPFTEQRVPMNAANLCPSPRAVSDRAAELTRDMDIDCSARNREKFAEMLENSRSQIAGQLRVTPDEIAFVRVIWDQNHPTNHVAWDVRAARFGIVVKRISTPSSPRSASELVDAFARALTPRTRVLSITHVSNTSGIRLPAKQLCEMARARGLHVHVDGAQTWGAFDINLRDLGCDSYSASAHKWFLGPREVGLLYVRKERIPEIWPNTVAPGWGDDATPDVIGARKFESLGQRDDAKLAALKTTADFHAAIGIPKVEARVIELATALKTKLKSLDMPVATPIDPALSGGVVIVRAAGAKGKEAYQTLDNKFGIAGAATGGLRLCPHIYNTMAHVEATTQWLTLTER